MADLDTRDKRMSMIALALPCGRVMPTLDGGFSTAAERAQLAYLYAFASAAPLVFHPWWASSTVLNEAPGDD